MENQQVSAEEMAAKKQELIASFAEQSEMLAVQLKYETLIADIEEQRLRALVAQMRAAQILAPAPESPAEGPTAPPTPRTLKKEK